MIFCAVIFFFTWVFYVCYPWPLDLTKSVYRFVYQQTDPSSEKLSFFIEKHSLGEDPFEIEEFVFKKISYSHDWQVYNMPWYFPTVEEVLKKEKGDCKARFILIASIFESFNIPYQLFFSPTHIWINYPGRQETRFENEEVALFFTGEIESIDSIIFLSRDNFGLKFPEVDWNDSREIFWQAFWQYMPDSKKKLIYQGLFFSVFLVLFALTASDKYFNFYFFTNK